MGSSVPSRSCLALALTPWRSPGSSEKLRQLPGDDLDRFERTGFPPLLADWREGCDDTPGMLKLFEDGPRYTVNDGKFELM